VLSANFASMFSAVCAAPVQGAYPSDGPIMDVLLSPQLASCPRARIRSSQVLRVPAMISTPMAGPTKYSPIPAAPKAGYVLLPIARYFKNL
jgi:hypothetical protein